MQVVAQDDTEFKAVILDGKPAKLNVATGEITLVTQEENNVTVTKKDSISTRSIISADKNINNTLNTSEVSLAEISDFYSVKDGETLLDIAKTYNVSLTDLKRANNLETTLISKGQKLRVKNFSQTTDYDSTLENENSNFHVVKKGNTLYSLARDYNLTLEELKSLNNLHSNQIEIGQKLRIKSFKTSAAMQSLSTYSVKKGDTLYRIALNNGTTVEALKSLNGLTDNVIEIGQILQLR